MEHYAEFDFAVVNERFEDALRDLRIVLQAARLATSRQPGLRQFTRMALA